MNGSTRNWPVAEETVPVRLMATIWGDTEGVHDDLETPADLDLWLDAVDSERASGASADELAAARALRDSLRRLAALQTDDPRPAAASPLTDPMHAAEILNAAAARLPAPQLRIDSKTRRLTRAVTADVPAALGQIATEAVELFGGPEAAKLRACLAPGCVLYFVKTHPRREWCSVACGNRARAARHYRRIQQANAEAGKAAQGAS